MAVPYHAGIDRYFVRGRWTSPLELYKLGYEPDDKTSFSKTLSLGCSPDQIREEVRKKPAYVAATTENISMLREFKAFISEHRDLIFTVLLITLLDSFLLNGALRTRLESILQATLKKAEDKLDAPQAPQVGA